MRSVAKKTDFVAECDKPVWLSGTDGPRTYLSSPSPQQSGFTAWCITIFFIGHSILPKSQKCDKMRGGTSYSLDCN